MKNQLLCTIGTHDEMIQTLKQISQTYELLTGKIKVYETPSSDELFLIYNSVGLKPGQTYLKNTMSIHAKKESNTFYTINALNNLIYELNGCFDKTYKVNWNDYCHTIILSADSKLKKIQIKYKEQFEV